MHSDIEHGYLLIADISGFTHFVAGSELDHSQAILGDILKLIVRNLTPALTVAEIEGDAVFAYASGKRLPRGETLLEIIERTYVEFRDKRASGRRMATCTCKACQMIPGLDLKFVIHHGEYVLQDIHGKKKPLGSSVNIVHRLLKNRISETTGWRGYSMFTEQSLVNMDVFPVNMHTQVETYEHLGEVKSYSVNLDDRYKELTDERRVFLRQEDAHVVVTSSFDLSPADLWVWLNDPEKRTSWRIGSHWHSKDRPGGRTGKGASNHCSNSNVVEHILDWRPFNYFTVEISKPPLLMTSTTLLEPGSNGTKLTCTFTFDGRGPRWMRRIICKAAVHRGMKLEESLEKLGQIWTTSKNEPGLQANAEHTS